MFGARRRPFAWLLWLLLALLPLRGWAQAAMVLSAPAVPVQALPCHGDLAEPGSRHLAPQGAAPSACSHCDLCQATAAPNEQPVPGLEALPQGAPAASAWRLPVAAVAESLFRPPRP